MPQERRLVENNAECVYKYKSASFFIKECRMLYKIHGMDGWMDNF
jgi:hypothetical protein